MRILLTIILMTCCLSACRDNSGNENEKLIRQYYEHFNKHEWTKMADLYSEVADFKDPSLGRGLIKQTRAQVVEKYTALGATFADVQDEIVKIYPSGDKYIVVEFVSRGTAPDNSKFELPICTIFTIEKSLITQDFTYYDNFETPPTQ